MPPKRLTIINTSALSAAVKDKTTLKRFLANKDNSAILLASDVARKQFVNELSRGGKTTKQINDILGQVAGKVKLDVEWS